ncbi:MAG: hypothetical protein ABH814_02255 [bacterium]
MAKKDVLTWKQLEEARKVVFARLEEIPSDLRPHVETLIKGTRAMKPGESLDDDERTWPIHLPGIFEW